MASTKRHMHLASGGVCVWDKQLRCKSSGLERLLLACPIRSQAETGQHAGRTTYSILNLIQSSPGGHGWSPDVSCTAYECNPLQGLTLTFPDGVKAGLEKRQKRFSGQGAQKGGEGSQGILETPFYKKELLHCCGMLSNSLQSELIRPFRGQGLTASQM